MNKPGSTETRVPKMCQYIPPVPRIEAAATSTGFSAALLVFVGLPRPRKVSHVTIPDKGVRAPPAPACLLGSSRQAASAAASRLGIPLPTLSRRIRVLERQLNVQLLERSARGAKPTDAGSRLYEHASRGIEALLEAEQAVVSDQARLKGRLRLSLPQTVEPWWELLAAFQRRYPDIQV